MSEWPLVPLDTLLTQHEPVRVIPRADDLLEFAGVRWYGAGLFVRESRRGVDVKGACYALKPGTLVYNRLFAWKQSFAAVGEEFAGVVVSNEFPQFDIDPDQATPAYLALFCSSPAFGSQALALSTGSTAISRNRLKEADFLKMRVAVPPVPVQRRIVATVAAADAYISALATEQSALKTLLAAMRQSLLSCHPRVPLASLCKIEAQLVSPTADDYADLMHIGVDAIEKGTGRLVAKRTAREDRVISAKYLVGEHDVVYSKIRPVLRKVALPGQVALCSADAYPLSPFEGVSPELLREVLLEDGFTQQMTSQSTRLKMPKVNRKELFTATVVMPSSEEERKQVVTTLDSIRGQLDAVATELEHARLARSALLDALLTRKVNLSLSSDSDGQQSEDAVPS